MINRSCPTLVGCVGVVGVSVALDHQLEQLGLSLPPSSLSDVAKVLMELWADHGDRIANQVRMGDVRGWWWW